MFVFFCSLDGIVEGGQLIEGNCPQMGKAKTGGGGDVIGHSDLGQVGDRQSGGLPGIGFAGVWRRMCRVGTCRGG